MVPVIMSAEIKILFLISLLCQCISQVTPPLTSWSLFSDPSLPSAASALIAGYDSTTRRIWLLVGLGTGTNNIWYYSIDDNSFTNTTNTLPYAVDTGAQRYPFVSVLSKHVRIVIHYLIISHSYTQMGRIIYYAAYKDASLVYTIQKFDMSTGLVDTKWDSESNNAYPIQNRAGPCLANDGRYIFVIGGDAGDVAGSQTQYYDTINDEWVTNQNIKTTRARASCIVTEDKNTLYIFGGTWDGKTPTSITDNVCNIETTIEKLDISDKTNINTISATSWNYVYDGSKMFILGDYGNNYWSRAVAYDGFIYLIGGRNRYTNPSAAVTFLDPSVDDVQFPESSTTARSSPGVVVADGRIYSFGGTIGPVWSATWERSNILTDAPTSAVCTVY